MGVYDVAIRRRSIRRFKQKKIDLKILKKLVNAARLAPSAANIQPLEFILLNNKELCDKIFNTIGWAGYLKPSWKPNDDQRPTAYIIIISEESLSKWYIRDASLAAGNICLCAEEENIGSCILAKIKKSDIKKILDIPNNYIIDTVVALGYKDEQPVIEKYEGSIKYWMDEKKILHVPKKNLDDITHIDGFKIKKR